MLLFSLGLEFDQDQFYRNAGRLFISGGTYIAINLAAGLQPKRTDINNDAHPHDFMASLSLEPKKLEEEDAPLV